MHADCVSCRAFVRFSEKREHNMLKNTLILCATIGCLLAAPAMAATQIQSKASTNAGPYITLAKKKATDGDAHATVGKHKHKHKKKQAAG
jgi:hypothetical protein